MEEKPLYGFLILHIVGSSICLSLRFSNIITSEDTILKTTLLWVLLGCVILGYISFREKDFICSIASILMLIWVSGMLICKTYCKFNFIGYICSILIAYEFITKGRNKEIGLFPIIYAIISILAANLAYLLIV